MKKLNIKKETIANLNDRNVLQNLTPDMANIHGGSLFGAAVKRIAAKIVRILKPVPKPSVASLLASEVNKGEGEGANPLQA